MIKFSKLTPDRFETINHAARQSKETLRRVAPETTPDIVDLSKFNAETNNIGFFKKLVKTIKIFFRTNFRND